MTETAMKLGMGVLLIAAAPVGGDPGVWAQWGLAGLVVCYTMWRDWQRERRMSDELQQHQTWVRDKLLGALERNSVALEKVASRPCPAQREEA
ncbi:MAG: hypothetical protein KatS3mg108_3890 [Isosphaeraceae bacterium]|jgi:hypothetical protein|nr:MAG: hypothetical protein KatS3mg108_3890 [Isosphaeraceae bacterium]